MKTTILVLSVLATGADYRPPEKVPVTGIGFRYDGTGVVPDAKPPVTWDGATGKNIRWKTPLPNWGYGCPVPVGNRVLMMTEQYQDQLWPMLDCFDADTGALVWRAEVNPLDAFPKLSAADRASVTADFRWIKDRWRCAYRAAHALGNKAYAAGDPALAAVNKDMAAFDMELLNVKPGYGLLRYIKDTSTRFKDTDKRINARKLGIHTVSPHDSQGSGTVGDAFATPVSDGECVYVHDNHNTVACYEIATGKRRWIVSSGSVVAREHLSSPRLWGDLLITANFDTDAGRPHPVHAWNKRTGALVWKLDDAPPDKALNTRDKALSRPGSSPIIITVGQTPVLLLSSGRCVRAADGKLFSATFPVSLGSLGVDPTTGTVFGNGSSDGGSARWAYRLRVAGDDVVATELWMSGRDGDWGGEVCAVFHDGRLFAKRVQFNPATGGVIGGKSPDRIQERDLDERVVKPFPRRSPDSRHVLLVANGHVYGIRVAGGAGKKGEPSRPAGVCEVYSLDGKLVATNTLYEDDPADWTAEQRERWTSQGFGANWSYSCPMNMAGNRLYVVSNNYLWCLEEGTKP